MGFNESKIDINKVFTLQPARPVTYFGVGAINKIGDIIKTLRSKGQGKILVVTDDIAYKACGAWNVVEPALNKEAESFEHYSGVRPNPTYNNCEEAARLGEKIQATSVLAIGGGSAIDTAKTAAVLLYHPGKKAVDFYEKGETITGALPIIAINTAHGTGSETNSFAIAQSDGHDKPAITSPHIYPTYSIDDPQLTLSLPLNQTISTSIDAINHSTEAATTITTTPYSIMLSREAIRLVSKYLPQAIVDPKNLVPRYWLMYASAIAGISFDIGLLHITHSMEHAMSAIDAKVTHGDGLGILLPAVIKEIYHAVPEVLSDLYQPIVPELKGLPGEGDYAAERIKEWFSMVGQPTSMGKYFSEKDVPKLVEMTKKSNLGKLVLPLSPVPVNDEVLHRIFKESL
jgi:alcohol dehydrogenase class IV